MSPVVIAVGMFAVALAGIALALRVFPRWGLLDFPERYGLNRARLPYPAGIVPVLLFLLTLPWLVPSPQSWYLCIAVTLLGGVSFWDDRARLPAGLRLMAHVIVATVVVLGDMRVTAITNPLPQFFADQGGSILLDGGVGFVFSIVFSIAWILLCINAINWFDGVPGQVSTLSTIGFATIAILAMSSRVSQPHVATIAGVLAALAAACALFEFPPSRLILGDSGAMFFGLMLAVLTIFSGGKVATGFLVLGIPLVDALVVIVRRLARGVPVWRGNAKDEHLHHRLLGAGLTVRQVLVFNAALGTAFGITALFLSTQGKVIASALLICAITLLSAWARPRSPRQPCTT